MRVSNAFRPSGLVLPELLFAKNWISEDQRHALRRRIARTAESPVALVSEMTRLPAGLLLQILIEYGYARHLRLGAYDIDAGMAGVVSEATARAYSVVPLERFADSLTLAMADPLHDSARAAVEHETGFSVHAVCSPAHEIKSAMEKLYGPSAAEERRSNPRFSGAIPVFVNENGWRTRGATRDLSVAGAQIVLPRAVMGSAEVLDIEMVLGAREHPQPLRCQGRLLRRRQHGDEAWLTVALDFPDLEEHKSFADYMTRALDSAAAL